MGPLINHCIQMIYKYVQYQFECEECPNTDEVDDIYSQAKAIKVMRKWGWTIGKKTLCPDCNGFKGEG